jgi:uncharacterized repeat protein (TIGR01451 family)
MQETPLAETRSIDDQILWLDAERVLYGTADDLWSVPADGSGDPRLFMSKAGSPTVLPTAPRIITTAGSPAALDLAATDLSIAATSSGSPATTGDSLTFTMTVTNHGPGVARDVRLGGALPLGLTFNRFGRPPSQPAGGYSCTFQDGFASCAIDQLASGASWTNTFTVVVAPLAADTDTSLATRFVVVATEPDPQPTNNQVTLDDFDAPEG